jgi:hypothetical protein
MKSRIVKFSFTSLVVRNSCGHVEARDVCLIFMLHDCRALILKGSLFSPSVNNEKFNEKKIPQESAHPPALRC